jgi:hypothetical protein
MLELKLKEELNRYKEINRYGKKLFNEQEEPLTPSVDPPLGGDLPVEPASVDPSMDTPPMTDTPPIVDEDNTEEMDITDLVNMTKSIKNDIDANKTDNSQVISKMDDVFSKLTDLEMKLSQMDSVISKIDMLGQKIETIKEPTPQEKLEMRSLDSYPFSQNPQQFFASKEGEMRASGKNEYVLTKNDVSNYSSDMIKKSFNPDESENDFKY